MDGYLRHLANFARIVEAGSLTGAANQRGVSPSSMSDSVRILEAHFGTPLLERRRSGVVPTGKGATILSDARTITAALDRAMGPAAPGQETVKVSAPQETAVFGWFTPALRRLRAEAPLIETVLLPEDRLEDHTRYARDLYVRVGRKSAAPGLTVLAEAQDQAILVGAPELVGATDPNDPTAVSRLPCLCAPSARGGFVLKTASGQITFADTIQAEGTNTRIALGREGLGVVACLRRSMEADLATGRMVRLLPQMFSLPVHIAISSPHTRPSDAVRQVADAFAGCLNSTVA